MHGSFTHSCSGLPGPHTSQTSRVAQTLVERWGKLCVQTSGRCADCSNCCLYGDDLRSFDDDMWPSQRNSTNYDVMNSFYEARQ